MDTQIKRWAVITDGVVTNLTESAEEFARAQGWIPAGKATFGDLWDGNTFSKPPAPAPIVPTAVSARQAKRALLEAGLLDDVQLAIDSITDDLERRRVQIDWVESTEFRRDWPALAMLAAAMQLDEGTLDALFIEAATL
jgi:hypothetical protein